MRLSARWRMLALVLGLGLVVSATPALEKYLEVEVQRLEEAYRLLDRFAADIWPGWDNSRDVVFRIHFPNLVQLLVKARGDPPAGYELWPGRTVAGMPVYLDRREALPLPVGIPLIGGGKGGLEVNIRLNQTAAQSAGSSDSQILVYVHEIFHGFQGKFGAPGDDRGLFTYLVTPEYAAYSEVEGVALEKAYTEKDRAAALEYVKDYRIAREMKQRLLPPATGEAEREIARSEGTATYAQLMMAMRIRDSRYRPQLSRRADPFFAGFRRLTGYLQENMTDDIQFARGFTFDCTGRYYPYGAYQCFLLDRFFPGWKKGFFEKGKDLDGTMDEFLRLGEKEKESLIARLPGRYSFSEVLAKHATAVRQRDEALAKIRARHGHTYIIDSQPLEEFCILFPRGSMYFLVGLETFYLEGIKDFRLGEIELASGDSPWRRTGKWTFEWVDAEAGGTGNPEISYEKKEGDVYHRLVLKTLGFVLKAPLARISEEGETGKTRITLLAKVSR